MPVTGTRLKKARTAKTSWLLIPLLLLVLPAGGVHAAIEAGQLRQVEQLIDQGKARQALTRVDALLAQDDEDPRPLFLKARAHEKAGQPQKAIEIYERLIREHPGVPEPFINLSVIYAGKEQYDDARKLLLKALGTSPLYAKVYQNLVDLHAAMASRAYKNALALPGETVKPALSAENTMSSWVSTEAISTSIALAAPDPKSDAGADQVVEPAPPITEPIKVSTRTVETARNGKAIATETAEPAVAAARQTAAVDEKERLERTIRAWADAWSRRDVDQYLGFYSERFDPAAGLSRRQWARQRKQRINSKKKIEIALNDFRFDLDGKSATVSFRQAYRSDTFGDVVRKRLMLERASRDWKIVRESVER